jgi:hypothetical protein
MGWIVAIVASKTRAMGGVIACQRTPAGQAERLVARNPLPGFYDNIACGLTFAYKLRHNQN